MEPPPLIGRRVGLGWVVFLVGVAVDRVGDNVTTVYPADGFGETDDCALGPMVPVGIIVAVGSLVGSITNDEGLLVEGPPDARATIALDGAPVWRIGTGAFEGI